MAEESGSLKTLTNLIPSVYYDLIARVSAGVPFLAILLWEQKAKIAEISSSETINFILLLGAGYVVGLLLTPFTWIWGLPIILFAKKTNPISLLAAWHWSRNDLIAAKDKEAGATLAKMQAESVLCQNLLTGFVLLVIVHDNDVFRIAAFTGHGSGFRWLMFCLLAFAVIQRQIVYYRRQGIFYDIYIGSQPKTSA